jgi:hypothetical protein
LTSMVPITVQIARKGIFTGLMLRRGSACRR